MSLADRRARRPDRRAERGARASSSRDRSTTTSCSRSSTRAVEFSLGGRFWVVVDGTEVVGFALESPSGWARCSRRCRPTRAACSPNRSPNRCRGVLGEAARPPRSPAAGPSATRPRSREIEGQRLYELTDVQPVATASGSLRLAGAGDRRPSSSGSPRSSTRPATSRTTRRPRRRPAPRARAVLGVGRRRCRSRWRARPNRRPASPGSDTCTRRRSVAASGYATACVGAPEPGADRARPALRAVHRPRQPDVERDLPAHRLRGRRRDPQLHVRVTQAAPGGGSLGRWRRWAAGGGRGRRPGGVPTAAAVVRTAAVYPSACGGGP